MDYSLLVGLHFRDENTGDKMGLSPFLLRTGKFMKSIPSTRFSIDSRGGMGCLIELVFPFSGNNDSFRYEKFMRGCRFLEAELQDMDRVLAGRYVFLPLVCFLVWSDLIYFCGL